MLTESFGIIGMLFILFAFIMNQTHRWKDDYLIYDLFNALGSIFLVVYSILIKGYPFLILNTAWFLVSIRDVLLDTRKIKKSKAHIGHKRR